MEVDVCVALMSRRTTEEENRAIKDLQDLDSLVDRGTDDYRTEEPEDEAGELSNPAPTESHTQGHPGELERDAMTTTGGSLVGRGHGPPHQTTTLPNFCDDLAQSVSELLPEILPSSQFDGTSGHCVAQGDGRVVTAGIYRPEIEFEPVNIIRDRGSNDALGVIKDDCDENVSIGFSQNDSVTLNDTLETQEGNKTCLVDCGCDKEHDRNCVGVNFVCSPVKTPGDNQQETGFETNCNSDLSNGEMSAEAGCIDEETLIQNDTSVDLNVNRDNNLDPQAGSVPDLTLEEPTLTAEITCDKIENMGVYGGCAEAAPGAGATPDHTCTPDRNIENTCSNDIDTEKALCPDDSSIEKTCSQDIDTEKTHSPDDESNDNTCSPGRPVETTCSCDRNDETGLSPDRSSESACSSDRGSQLALGDIPLSEAKADSLSPTVNLDFGAVYWSKDKSKSEKDEEIAGNVVVPPSRRALHVSFASEESLVSGCMEPAIPWMEAWLCSTPELVAAYKTACECVGVKPLKKLLAQLEGVKRFDVRSDLLSLKGESLDWKHCETLEAIFKRVQFNSINIEEMRLDDEVAVTMFDLLQYYQSCLRLIMNRSTNLGTRGWQAWTRLMKQSTGLLHLEARGLSIPDHTLPVIGKYLRTGSMLRTLQLENSIRSGRHLNLLASAMRTSQSVQELYLGDNQLMPADGLQLGTMLKGNSSLRLLDVRNNLLQDTGMVHICDGVADQANVDGLNTLVVWNNQISHQSMPALSRALATTKSLETLNIGHNSITNDGIYRLKEGLVQNKTLVRIGLQATKISCEGAVALAEFVAESLKLVRLDLRENSIRTGGLMALSLSLKVNQTVTCVDLDKEPKKESGMKDYAEQQRRLLSDIVSFATRNSLLVTASDDQTSKGHDLESPTHSDDPTTTPNPEDEPTASTRAASSFSLTLTIPTRCETLESPSYWPDHLSLLTPPTDRDDPMLGTASPPILNPKPTSPEVLVAPPVKPEDIIIPSSLASLFQVPPQDASKAVASAPAVQKPPVPEKPSTAPQDKKLVRTKRKFTISRAVLPSAPSPKPTVASTAVLFTARPSAGSDDCQLDSDTHVCIVGTSLSDASSSVGDLHPLVKKFSVSLLSDVAVADGNGVKDSSVVADVAVAEGGAGLLVAGKNKETVVVAMDEIRETVVMETSENKETVVVVKSESNEDAVLETCENQGMVPVEVSERLEPVVALTSDNSDVVVMDTGDNNKSIVVEMSENHGTVFMETSDSHETVVVETSDNNETVVMETCESNKTVVVETSDNNETVVVETSDDNETVTVKAYPSVAAETCVASCRAVLPETCDFSSAFVSESTLTSASVSTDKEFRLDLRIPEIDQSHVDSIIRDSLSTNEDHLPMSNHVLVASDSTSDAYPAEEKGWSLAIGGDHFVIDTGSDHSSSSLDVLGGHPPSPSIDCAVISVTSNSLDHSETSRSDPSAWTDSRSDEQFPCDDAHLPVSNCSADSVASITLERWSVQTEEESSNFLVQVTRFEGAILSEDAIKTLGNNGQDCFNLGLDDLRKSNSVSSSEGTVSVSDCDEFMTATEESESENSDVETTRWKSGEVASFKSKADEGRVFEREDSFVDAVSVMAETQLVYGVKNLKHDVLDSVNANSAMSEH